MRALIALLLVTGAVCVCGSTAEVGVWCPFHDVGVLGGQTIKSAWVFETLDAHGHDVDLSVYTCTTCRKAIETEGFCDEHRQGFVSGKAYFSWLTYALAHGARPEPAAIRCPTCRKNAASGGWCDKDQVGMLGGRAIAGRAAYDRTLRSLEIVKIADREAARCKHCGAAIVTDTACPFCKIQYKDGKKVEP